MLYTKTDSTKYIAEFKDRFSNFANKAPILLSFVTSDKEVKIVHENSGTAYSFEWDFSIPVKAFIHEIKQTLSDLHYPRIARVKTTVVPMPAEDRQELLSAGVNEADIPEVKKIETSEIFRIDKVIVLKDIFIIQSETDYVSYRYKMNYSSIFFLKDYRTGKYKSIEEAGKFFFSRSELLNVMPDKTT